MKIGLFFGSFNPIHHGHMVLANYLLEYTELDKVWFVISPHNPLKQKSSLLDERHRLALVELAIGDHPHLKASNIEFNLPQPSYTIHTLAYLQEKFPGKEFVLLMGTDNLESFPKWKNYQEILANHRLFVYPRQGYSGGALNDHPQVVHVNAPEVEISSTMIRSGIKEGKDLRYFVPDAAWKYIREMHFYEK